MFNCAPRAADDSAPTAARTAGELSRPQSEAKGFAYLKIARCNSVRVPLLRKIYGTKPPLFRVETSRQQAIKDRACVPPRFAICTVFPLGHGVAGRGRVQSLT